MFKKVAMTQKCKKILWGTAGTMVAVFPAIMWGHVEGPDARHSGAPGDAKFSCADVGMCHTSMANGGPVNALAGSVNASFSSGTTYIPGGGPVTIMVTVTDPVNTYFGFQMSARLDSDLISGQAGHFATGGPNEAVICDYTSADFMNLPEGPNGCGVDGNGVPVVEFIEHAFPSKTSSAQTTPYTITWTPPAANVGPVHFYVAGNAVNNDQMAGPQDHVYTNSYILTPAAALPPPTIASGGVLNAASFAKDSKGLGLPVAPGSLVAIFGSNLGSAQADASTVPFPALLGNVSVKFGSFPAALRDVLPALPYPSVNAQVPFETPLGTQNVVVTVNGVASAAQPAQIVAQAPGVFTIPSGVGNAVLVNLTPNDFSIAAPTGSIPGLATHPIARGTKAFFYATGLGVMTPAVKDGDDGGSTTHNAVTPVVMVGGITAPVTFAGQAPGYPGVYQVNITIPQTAPTGSAVDLQIQSADGSILSAPKISTIAIQ